MRHNYVSYLVNQAGRETWKIIFLNTLPSFVFFTFHILHFPSSPPFAFSFLGFSQLLSCEGPFCNEVVACPSPKGSIWRLLRQKFGGGGGRARWQWARFEIVVGIGSFFVSSSTFWNSVTLRDVLSLKIKKKDVDSFYIVSSTRSTLSSATLMNVKIRYSPPLPSKLTLPNSTLYRTTRIFGGATTSLVNIYDNRYRCDWMLYAIVLNNIYNFCR